MISGRSNSLFVLFFVLIGHSFAQNSFSVVSAASYQTAVAPTSLATIFGSGLATSTESATLDSSGQLPSKLAGSTVEINGEIAGLIYASPSQINLLIPDDIATGSADVVVRTAVGAVLRGTAHVTDTAPGLFSLDASGKGPGAILNAVTFTAAPFLVETSAIAGSDRRTRLAVYATGIRWAGNPAHDPSMTNTAGTVTLIAHDNSGNSYDVEYAGAAPGFFGLDQVNIVLPPDMDGAGVVSLVLSTDTGGSSNTITFRVNALPLSALHLAGITLSPAFVTAGDQVQGTVSLNGRAPLGGVIVSLQSTSAAARPPLSVTIPQGKSSVDFTVATASVSSTQTATITARAGTMSQTATLEIDSANAVQLRSFTVDVSSVQGGRNVSLTAALSGSAPVNGVSIPLTSDNSAIKVPAVLKIPFGQQLATVSVPTSIVSSAQTVHVSATLGRTTQTVTITLNPPFTLTLSSDSVIAGNNVAGTVTLTETRPATTSVVLKSSDPAAQIQPVTLTLAPNQTIASFTITTTRVTALKTVVISASTSLIIGFTATASLTINPPGSAELQSVSITPAVVNGGQAVAGTVTLSNPAPAGGVTVTLKSSDLLHAQLVQPFILVSAGQTTGSFTITTTHAVTAQTVTITATAGGVSKTATLKIQ